MTSSKTPSQEFHYQFLRIVAKYNALEERPTDFGCGVDLYPAEIHTIAAIGDNPKTHLAEVARILGVTRGSTQQMVGKLIDKELVEKYRDPNDRKKVFLKLTRKGSLAFAGHEEYHTELNSYLDRYFESQGPEEADSILRFFEVIEDVFEKYYVEKYGECSLPSNLVSLGSTDRRGSKKNRKVS